MNTEKIKKGLQSKKFQNIVAYLFIIIVALVIFRGGMEIGYMKASFRYQADQNYHLDSLPNNFSGAHGVSGKVVSINLPNLVVADRDGTEKVVEIEDETIIRKAHDTITASLLATGDFIVVIGEPNENTQIIEAKFIRVMPAPGTAPQAPTNAAPQSK